MTQKQKIEHFGISETQFFHLPMSEQRRLLGLPEGHNPSAPSWMKAPKAVVVPQK